jgi:transposase
MRGEERDTASMFSYISPERRVPKDHPLRPIRAMVDAALEELSARFDAMYSRVGRPSIPPEKLLRVLLLQVLYTIRSERLLMEQLDYNLLFRWFVGLEMDDEVWDATVFSKNRDRLLEAEIAQAFFNEILEQARQKKLLSNEHFTVDGTMVAAWAGQKSFKKKGGGDSPPTDGGGNPTVDFRGEKRSNETHQSTTDPEARLFKKAKGQESKLCYLGHVLMENRNGLVVDTELTQASGRAEREAALWMVKELRGIQRLTLGGDKAYDAKVFVEDLRDQNVTPHVAQNTTNRPSAIDGRTTRHCGYEMSQRARKRIEEVFGWMKTIGPMAKTKYRGRDRVGWMFTFTAAAYNLIRIRNLTVAVT